LLLNFNINTSAVKGGRGFVQYGDFADKGLLQMRTAALFGVKISDIFLRTKKRGLIFSRFCADVFYGWPYSVNKWLPGPILIIINHKDASGKRQKSCVSKYRPMINILKRFNFSMFQCITFSRCLPVIRPLLSHLLSLRCLSCWSFNKKITTTTYDYYYQRHAFSPRKNLYFCHSKNENQKASRIWTVQIRPWWL